MTSLSRCSRASPPLTAATERTGDPLPAAAPRLLRYTPRVTEWRWSLQGWSRDGRAAASNLFEFMHCPTCTEATAGLRYSEWVSQGGITAAGGRRGGPKRTSGHEPEPEPEPSEPGDTSMLSPCQFVAFEVRAPAVQPTQPRSPLAKHVAKPPTAGLARVTLRQ